MAIQDRPICFVDANKLNWNKQIKTQASLTVSAKLHIIDNVHKEHFLRDIIDSSAVIVAVAKSIVYDVDDISFESFAVKFSVFFVPKIKKNYFTERDGKRMHFLCFLNGISFAPVCAQYRPLES